MRLNNKLAENRIFYKRVTPEFVPKKKRRLNNTQGVFSDLPDWSFINGKPGPPTNKQTERKAIQRQICERIIMLSNEINKAEKLIDNNKIFKKEFLKKRKERLIIK